MIPGDLTRHALARRLHSATTDPGGVEGLRTWLNDILSSGRPASDAPEESVVWPIVHWLDATSNEVDLKPKAHRFALILGLGYSEDETARVLALAAAGDELLTVLRSARMGDLEASLAAHPFWTDSTKDDIRTLALQSIELAIEAARVKDDASIARMIGFRAPVT